MAALPGRPPRAVGTFLRLITINDCYKLDNYPRVASVVLAAKAQRAELNVVVTSHMNGDFLSPSMLTAMDGGKSLTEGLSKACIDYACLGNHEFDLGFARLAACCAEFTGTVSNSIAPTAVVLRPLPTHAAVSTLSGVAPADSA